MEVLETGETWKSTGFWIASVKKENRNSKNKECKQI
jgi:hypothetical protein